MDFLGLRNLSIIDDTLTAVKRVYNRTIRLNQIPLDDETTLALFRKGETSGVFQFESAGIRNVLRKLGPTSIEDIAAVNALYRPGPMQNIDVFIRRKKAWNKLVIQSLVSPHFGKYVRNYCLPRADYAVAAKWQASLGKLTFYVGPLVKRKDVLDEERNHFVNGALQQGYPQETANQVYDYIERFANYGFNRSHAFAYSFIGFQMAYLKVHYPSAFMSHCCILFVIIQQKLKNILAKLEKQADDFAAVN